MGPPVSPPRSELALLAAGLIGAVVACVLLTVDPGSMWPIIVAVPSGCAIGGAHWKLTTRIKRLNGYSRAVDEEWRP